MTITAYTDDSGEIRWRAQAANSRIVADGSEGYERARDAGDGVLAALRAILGATDADLAGGPLDGYKLEDRVRLAVADYLAREASLLRAGASALPPEVVDALDAGAQIIVLEAEAVEGLLGGGTQLEYPDDVA